MSIVSNFYLKGSKKQLAGAVYYKSGGRTISRQLADSVTNPRTRAQMMQRVRWANCVAFYRANASWMKYAYESKKAFQSEYNKFMSLNVANNRIYLTKQAAASGACVVDEFVMTQGSLPSITYSDAGDSVITNIYVPTSFEPSENITVAQFAQAVLAENPGVQENDQLSFIRYTQMVNEQTGYPYVIVRKYEVLLDLSNPQPLSNYWPMDLISFIVQDSKQKLEIIKTGNAGGLLLVLSRTIGGKTYVSTQSILPIDNQSTISAWSSASALNRAINSYGESTEAFLSSDSAGYAENEPIQLVPLSIEIDSITYVAGNYVGHLADFDGKTLKMNFNQDFAGTISNIWIDTDQASSGTIAQPTATIDGNAISWAVSKGSIGSNAAIRAIRVVADSGTYRMDFATSIGGLE